MADSLRPEKARPPITTFFDAYLSGVLRYDLSRQDVVKWVDFARQVLAILLVSVISIAGLSAVISTKQAEGLLLESLSAQGRAVADALARASFVPLALDDQATLRALIGSYEAVDNLSGIAILDAEGRALQRIGRTEGKGAIMVKASIVPILAPGEAPRERAPLGTVEVRMWSGRIEEKARAIAFLNIAISAALTAVVSIIGFFMIRNLVTRMRELVGEARLVEEIRQVNSELEAFSYSVAHDLRAPLRHINGFVDLLQKRGGAAIPEESRRYLNMVADSSRRMGTMIDDLLSFSRMSRAEIKKRRTAIEPLVRQVISDSAPEQQGRRIEWKIGALPEVECDPAMIQMALANLIGNALKFTRGKDPAVIEVGSRTDKPGFVTIFVKDNGAGFEMEYASKLFGVFQRLHGQHEFEGTGIGLANVRRIINRHDGETWAEGAPGQGATFYFSLPSRRGK